MYYPYVASSAVCIMLLVTLCSRLTDRLLKNKPYSLRYHLHTQMPVAKGRLISLSSWPVSNWDSECSASLYWGLRMKCGFDWLEDKNLMT